MLLRLAVCPRFAMNIGLKELLTTALRQSKLRRRLILLLLVYFGVAGILLGLSLQQRSEAVATTYKALVSFAQLTEEQTTRTIQSTEQTLDIAEARIAWAAEAGAGSASSASVRAALRDLLASRPFLKAITILDRRGRTVYSSQEGEPGLDLSERAYFIHHRDDPVRKFLLGAPIRARSTAEWIIPASRPLLLANGDFAGVIVASLDPIYFGHLWTNEQTIEAQATALWRKDGTVMMRSPFDAQSMGTTLKWGVVANRLNTGNGQGTTRAVSLIDGQDRLIAYRLIAAYPDFGLTVTQVTDRALAAWRRTAWMVALGWAAAGAALAWLALGLIRESTERQATQDRYSLIFRANPYPMVVMDRESQRMLAANDAAVEEYGWSREEILAMPANNFYPPDELPGAAEMRLADGTDDTRVIRGLRHRRKDGTIFDVKMHRRSLELDAKPAVLTIIENVTERQAVEAQLRQSQKMEVVGQLTGGIAHDFNNILFVISANVEELQEEEGPDTTKAERFDKISAAVERASALTRQLLAFSRKQMLRPQQTDLNDLVSSTGKLLRRALGAQIEIDSILADNLCVADIDRAQLETALVNLCINARDAMADGGRLLIETRNVTLDKDYADSNVDAVPGHYAMIAVTDTGAGIPPESLAKVFEPFFTTKEVGKGTGLGLSMVYGFIKQSRGHIKIYSEVGIGTSFKLYLPCSGVAAEQSSPLRNASLPRGTERILVVEDDPHVRPNVVRQLQSLGYDVVEAADGQTAVTAFEDALFPYDLLLTDVVMPGPLNGKALADEVGRRWPKTKVVFMSGFTETSAARHGRLDQHALLLNKPFRKADLAQMIRQALDVPGRPDGELPKVA